MQAYCLIEQPRSRLSCTQRMAFDTSRWGWMSCTMAFKHSNHSDYMLLLGTTLSDNPLTDCSVSVIFSCILDRSSLCCVNILYSRIVYFYPLNKFPYLIWYGWHLFFSSFSYDSYVACVYFAFTMPFLQSFRLCLEKSMI